MVQLFTHLRMTRLQLTPERSHEVKAAPGCILKVTKDELEVQTGNGVLALLEVQLEGKKRMTTDAFLRGYQVTEGSFLKRC